MVFSSARTMARDLPDASMTHMADLPCPEVELRSPTSGLLPPLLYDILLNLALYWLRL